MNILIIDKVHQILINKLSRHNFKVEYTPFLSPGNVIRIIGNYEGLIIRSKLQLTKQIIAKGKNLRFIARVGSGLENIDTKYASSKNIICINSPEGNRNAVAEHALGMLLCFFNKICSANTEIKQGTWDRDTNTGIELTGKTIGIIGYGNTGNQFSKKLSAFDMNILAYDKYRTGFGNDLVKEVKLDEIFNKTDILSLHIPLSAETHYMINDNFIRKFKKNIYLINTARGKVVCTKDLIKNIKTKKILGAMLDVLEYESENLSNIEVNNNSSFEYLKNSKNVLLTPHVAGKSEISFQKLSEVLAKKIIEKFEAIY